MSNVRQEIMQLQYTAGTDCIMLNVDFIAHILIHVHTYTHTQTKNLLDILVMELDGQELFVLFSTV